MKCKKHKYSMILLNEGIVIAIVLTMVITSLCAWLREHIKNSKVKFLIPSGMWIAAVAGIILIFILGKVGVIADKTATIWQFIEAWLIVFGLSGFGKIAGVKIMTFIKAFFATENTQIVQAEKEIEDLKKQIAFKKERIKYVKKNRKKITSKD